MIKIKICMLTTIDNPFNPFTQWDDWLRFDTDHKYFTCEYLARIAITSDDLSVADYAKAVENAINEIIELNILGIYKKVSVESPETGGDG